MKSEKVLTWIDSAGGTLILLEESLLKHWRGFDLANDPNYITDYDRACEIDEYVGTIPVDSEYGLVFGEVPHSTAWLNLSGKNDGIIVRWEFGENESEVIEALSNLPDVEWEDTGVEIEFSDDKLILFDSAFDGTQIDESLEIKMPEGKYKVQTFHYAPNKQTSLILHRFQAIVN